MNDKKIDERTFEFALKIVHAYKFLVDRKDFTSKMAIASKEARDTLYRARLLAESGFFNGHSPFDDIYTEIRSIINIITRIVKTTTEKNSKLNTQNLV